MKFPDVPIYDEMPEGWADISHIVSAPSGYHWINNRKSIFTKEYRHALLRIRIPFIFSDYGKNRRH